MTQRAILTYKKDGAPKTDKGLRLFIKDGFVVNTNAEAKIRDGLLTGDLTAVRLRRSGEKTRILTWDGEALP